MYSPQNEHTNQPLTMQPDAAVPSPATAQPGGVQQNLKHGFWSVSSGVIFILALLVIPVMAMFFMAGFSNVARTDDQGLGYMLLMGLLFSPILVIFLTIPLSLAGTITSIVALAQKQKLATLWVVLNSLSLSASVLWIVILFFMGVTENS